MANEETGPGLEPTGEIYIPPPGVVVGNFKNHPAYKRPLTRQEVIESSLSPGLITDRVVFCHCASWDAGWWHDIKTGARLERNRAEMMMLMVSELAEAAHGLDTGAKDDKLPKRPMLEVEIADFLIRLYDYCGGFELDLQAAVADSEIDEPFDVYVHPVASTPALWRITQHVCEAMEGDRKKDAQRTLKALARAHRMAIWYAAVADLDVIGALVEKVEYNRTRADHQRAARLAPGGKAY